MFQVRMPCCFDQWHGKLMACCNNRKVICFSHPNMIVLHLTDDFRSPTRLGYDENTLSFCSSSASLKLQVILVFVRIVRKIYKSIPT
ncbi:hypothetical protein CEXT_577711 [Caerostris extrusa]|uniref:Uncharacterized protein n=1 Tax=Caerostris extrusa TaxID=172846 RepID=A0AAV4V7C6_CAEEX|nr:hypothetical protein CEXT_577711 [Caerostris extrusa]